MRYTEYTLTKGIALHVMVRDSLTNYLNNRHGILFVTPHQLSTEAKQLIRNGVSDVNFVKEVAEKGYTELSKQLDQVVDLELYIHIGTLNKKPVLTIQRGKHRRPDIIDDKYKYAILHFPHRAPIKETLGKPKADNFGNEKNNDDDFDM